MNDDLCFELGFFLLKDSLLFGLVSLVNVYSNVNVYVWCVRYFNLSAVTSIVI